MDDRVTQNNTSQSSTSLCFSNQGFNNLILPSQNILGLSERISSVDIGNSQQIFTLFTYIWPENSTKYDTDKTYLSDVLSVFIKQNPNTEPNNISNLSAPIKFCHMYENTNQDIQCGFSEGGSVWRTEGCMLIAKDPYNATHSIALCECNHLTDFGIFSGFTDITSSSNFAYIWEEEPEMKFNIPGNLLNIFHK